MGSGKIDSSDVFNHCLIEQHDEHSQDVLNCRRCRYPYNILNKFPVYFACVKKAVGAYVIIPQSYQYYIDKTNPAGQKRAEGGAFDSHFRNSELTVDKQVIQNNVDPV